MKHLSVLLLSFALGCPSAEPGTYADDDPIEEPAFELRGQACDDPDVYVPEREVYDHGSGWAPGQVLQWPPGPGPELLMERDDDGQRVDVDLFDDEADAGPDIAAVDIVAGDPILLLAGARAGSQMDGRWALATPEKDLLIQVNFSESADAGSATWEVEQLEEVRCSPAYAPELSADVESTITEHSVGFWRDGDGVELEPGESADAFGFRFAVGESLRYEGGDYDAVNPRPTWTLITRLGLAGEWQSEPIEAAESR